MPSMPLIIGGGMIKAFCMMFLNLHLVDPTSGMFSLMMAVGDAPFYFIAISIGFSCAKTFGMNPMFGIGIAAGLLYEKEFYPVEEPMDEDCLYLNVWTPAQSTDEKLPVMFWVHGGIFITGYGYSAQALLTSPLTKGMVSKAIMQSGGGVTPFPDTRFPTLADAEAQTDLSLLGVGSIAEARKLSWQELLERWAKSMPSLGLQRTPVVDGWIVNCLGTIWGRSTLPTCGMCSRPLCALGALGQEWITNWPPPAIPTGPNL